LDAAVFNATFYENPNTYFHCILLFLPVPCLMRHFFLALPSLKRFAYICTSMLFFAFIYFAFSD